VKADFLALRGGWEQSNWAGNKGQLEIALPVGTRELSSNLGDGRGQAAAV
jgi:hypothetical protein